MIEIKNLTKKYGDTLILKDVSYSFKRKGLVCLLGASGCGKSTLLNMLAGFDSDYSGEILVCNTAINKMNSEELCRYRRDNIGFVFQNYHLLSGYTVLQNILLSRQVSESTKQENIEHAKHLLERLGISDKFDEKIENLSGGQKQRAAIARALIGNPKIILADEPTGALDRKNATEIMAILKELSSERLVVVITHDPKICAFADEIINISEFKITSQQADSNVSSVSPEEKLVFDVSQKSSPLKLSLKNFKVHLARYIAVSLAISIGIFAFILSLSSSNVIGKSILDFQEKNTASNNGYIKSEKENDELLKMLQSDERIDNVYYQYLIKDVTLTMGDTSEFMAEKYPMAKAAENMSYGVMPRIGKNEIVLSPSLAKKFASDISSLIGKELAIKYNNTEYKLTVSGICNAGYDDFFISSDVEKLIYENSSDKQVYSISYDVKDFDNIVAIDQMLKEQKVEAKTAAKEVFALQTTFNNISRLFFIVSALILAIGLFISIILLVKLQNSRYKELGLMSALGFNKRTIRSIIINENLLLSLLAAAFNAVLIGALSIVVMVFKFSFAITFTQIIVSILSTAAAVIAISLLSGYKLLNTEPAEALRK